MDAADFLVAFEQARAARETLVCFAHCAVTYSGRAEAHLPRGDRLLILKQDGVLLIHQPEKGNPINYLKAGAELSVERREQHLLLKGRLNKEFLEVELFRIYNAMRQKLEDGQQQVLHGNEAEMSDHLRDHPELIAPDFRPVSREEHTKVGFLDLFGHDGSGTLVVVECKRYTAGLSAVSQLRRYVEKMKKLRGTERVQGVLASPKITSNAEEMLKEYGFAWRMVEPPHRHARHDKAQQRLNEFSHS